SREVPAPGLDDGGILWFVDLTAPDPTLLLPVAIGIANWANIEMNMAAVKNPTLRQRALKHVFQLLALVAVPIATQVPSIISVYWLTSAGYSLVQNALIRKYIK
ncbi:Cytochrome c oxidase assembly protein cox18, mitochondrial, partial [Cladochytrium tenue]